VCGEYTNIWCQKNLRTQPNRLSPKQAFRPISSSYFREYHFFSHAPPSPRSLKNSRIIIPATFPLRRHPHQRHPLAIHQLPPRRAMHPVVVPLRTPVAPYLHHRPVLTPVGRHLPQLVPHPRTGAPKEHARPRLDQPAR